MARGIEPRSRWEILLDILNVISEKGERAKKTRIMQNAYLDWRNFQRHFSFLQEHGFVENNSDPEEGTSYYLTEKGKDLLMKLQEVREMLQTSSTEYIEDDDLGIEGKGKGEGKRDNANIRVY